jgi:5-methylcytosine-specific restriction endonuclease McrA
VSGIEQPKPRKRIRAAGVGMAVVRAEQRCRICGKRTHHLEAHHLVPRSQGGDDVPDNFVPLCGPWQPSCHQRVTENHPDALRALRAALRPAEVAYIVERKGQAWLDRRYPHD